MFWFVEIAAAAGLPNRTAHQVRAAEAVNLAPDVARTVAQRSDIAADHRGSMDFGCPKVSRPLLLFQQDQKYHARSTEVERSEFDQSQELKVAVVAAVARTVPEIQRAALFSALLPIAVELKEEKEKHEVAEIEVEQQTEAAAVASDLPVAGRRQRQLQQPGWLRTHVAVEVAPAEPRLAAVED